MHCQKPLCLKALSFFKLPIFDKGSFSRNFTSTLSLASLLKVVQYYDLGNDYFKKRSEIIDNLKINDINTLASKLFDKNNLFFMIVGKTDT